jgi:ACS family pantothenate transporter-like MFS transporter
MLDLNIQPAGQAFSLYLKSFPERYSVVQVNTLPTVVSAINIVSALVAGITADRLGKFWVPALITTVPVLIGMILLNVWHVGFSGRLAAFMLIGFMARAYTPFPPSSFPLTHLPTHSPPPFLTRQQQYHPWPWAGQR